MKPWWRPVLCLSLLVLLPLSAQAVGAPFLWRVFGARAPHYIAGSVHLAPDTDELPSVIEDAYDQASGVVFETDLGALQSDAAQQQLLLQGRAGAGGLQAELGSRAYEQVQNGLRRLGMPPRFCDSLRAWFCGLMVEVALWHRAGFDAASGVDEQIYADAQDDGKRIRWFEAPQAHLALLSGMPPAMAREFLQSSLEQDADPAQSPQAIYRAWRNNDVAALEKSVAYFKRQSPQAYDRLLAGRNRDWMPRIERILGESETQMIVVGAAHCVGPDGLIAQLKAKGYTVAPVFNVVPTQAAQRAHTTPLLAAR